MDFERFMGGELFVHLLFYQTKGTGGASKVMRQFLCSTEVTSGLGDLCVCYLGGCTRAHEHFVSHWRGVSQGSPQGQTLRALLLRGTSVLHWIREPRWAPPRGTPHPHFEEAVSLIELSVRWSVMIPGTLDDIHLHVLRWGWGCPVWSQ